MILYLLFFANQNLKIENSYDELNINIFLVTLNFKFKKKLFELGTTDHMWNIAKNIPHFRIMSIISYFSELFFCNNVSLSG